MRRLLTLVLAPVLALAFFVLGNPAAHAFGSEVLGCGFAPSYTWTASSCSGTGKVQFSPHNLSGTYSYGWTITSSVRTSPITNQCNGTSYPCISSGCTTTSSTCVIDTLGIPRLAQTVTASLRLTQSGQTRTIQAVANIPADTICINCT